MSAEAAPAISRRAIFSVATLAGIGATGIALAEPRPLAMSEMKKETDSAAVYHCDFGDAARFGQMLNNINNHLAAYENDPFKIKIVVVAHAAGVKFFLQELSGTPWEKEVIDPDLAKRMLGLAQYGVEAYICRFTFTRLKIDTAKLRTEAYMRMVPSGVATVAELQGKGFGYLKIG
jgi:intracellular sulfur oxidation DsrE/DsrF family protein